MSSHCQGQYSLSRVAFTVKCQHSLSRSAFTASVSIHCHSPHSLPRSAWTVMWAFTFAYGHRVLFKLRLPHFVGWANGRCFCFKHRLRPNCPDRILWMPWIWRTVGHNTRSISRWSLSFEQHSDARTEPTLRSWHILLSWSINSLRFLKPSYVLPRS